MDIGKIQTLTVAELNTSGYILQDELEENAFLPKVFVKDTLNEGDEVQVFVFQDDGRLKATTETPLAQVGQFAVMHCVQSLPSGAFMDWGIIKDLFIPYKQQKSKIEETKRYLVYVYIDEPTGLITGTTRFKRNPQYEDLPFNPGDKVELIVMNEGELGWNVVINQQYIGLIYASDVYKKMYPLSNEIGYIKQLREDGKIDVSLQRDGYEHIDEFQRVILDKLEQNYGLLYLTDKSTPEEIKEELEMSKKNFKKAIGGLYKSKSIEIMEDKIRLI